MLRYQVEGSGLWACIRSSLRRIRTLSPYPETTNPTSQTAKPYSLTAACEEESYKTNGDSNITFFLCVQTCCQLIPLYRGPGSYNFPTLIAPKPETQHPNP